MDACSATISVSGTRGLAEDHVHACSATISVSGTRGAGGSCACDHMGACSATSSVSGTLRVPVRPLVE